MKLPFFSRQPNADAEGFYPTGINPDAIQEDDMRVAGLGDKKVIITRSDGDLVAFSSVCPHAAADLSQGRLTRGQIKCPDHSYTFDVHTGRAIWPEGEGCRLFRYAVKVQGEELLIRLSS
jgi:nitrite reductase/ring-hydroxylating ferredoxin subunit